MITDNKTKQKIHNQLSLQHVAGSSSIKTLLDSAGAGDPGSNTLPPTLTNS
jgi:hypothetical protein